MHKMQELGFKIYSSSSAQGLPSVQIFNECTPHRFH